MSTFIGMGVNNCVNENKNIKKLEKENKALEKQVETLTEEKASLESQVETLTAQNSELTGKIAELEKKVETKNKKDKE